MNHQIEPHSDIRENAATMFQLFVAYVQAGFTEEQAMTLLREIVRAQVIASNAQDDET